MLQVRSKDLHNALKADRLAFYFPQQRKKKLQPCVPLVVLCCRAIEGDTREGGKVKTETARRKENCTEC